MSPPRIPSAIRAPTSAKLRFQKNIGNNEPGRTLLNFGHSMSNEAMPMQIAGPSNHTNPLHIVLPTCLHPFRTTIRNRPATQAAAQAIEPARLLLLPERRGPISRVGNTKPRVGMSILLAGIQKRFHERIAADYRASLKPLREGADHRDILAIKRTAFPTWHMESGPTSSPPSRKQRRRNARQRNQNRQKMPQWGLPAEKSFRIVRKRRKGASF